MSITTAYLLAEAIAQKAPVVDAKIHNRQADPRHEQVEVPEGEMRWAATYALLVYEENEAPGLEGTGRMAKTGAMVVGSGKTIQDARDDLRGKLLKSAQVLRHQR